MNAAKAESLALQRLYHWERTAPDRIVLSQPMGNGVVRDFAWAQVADQVRRMAAHLKAQGWEPGSQETQAARWRVNRFSNQDRQPSLAH